jgi:hypothetical protein
LTPEDVIRTLKRFEKLRREGRDLSPGHPGGDKNELVPAKSPHKLRRHRLFGQSLGHGFEEVISHRVAEAVVEPLEPVQIKKENCQVVGGSLCDLLFQVRPHTPPVGHASQPVMRRLMGQRVLLKGQITHEQVECL